MKPKSTPDPATLRERALGYLARREHSRFELTRKLEAAGFEVEDIQPTLDEFEARAWLSDRRFAENYVAGRQAKYGNIKLAYELHQRGIDSTTIETVLNKKLKTERERACIIRQRKFADLPTNAADKAQQLRFLISRGFEHGVCYFALSHAPHDENPDQ